MGTHIVETDQHGNTVRILAHVAGDGWTDEADMAISNGRKREQAEVLIARAKRNARVIADNERAQQGRRHEQTRTLAALADSLPFGTRVEFDDQGTPVSLVNMEDTPEQATASVESETPTRAPNRFDAIALEAANA